MSLATDLRRVVRKWEALNLIWLTERQRKELIGDILHLNLKYLDESKNQEMYDKFLKPKNQRKDTIDNRSR